MTIFAMQPVVIQGYRSETKRVRDAVAEAIEPAPEDVAKVSAVAEALAVELDGPAVRWDRISELRARIAAGTYRVPSMEIAEKMVEGMTRSF